VQNYYLKQPRPYVWKGDSEAWKEIFSALGLKVRTQELMSKKEMMSEGVNISIKNNTVRWAFWKAFYKRVRAMRGIL
jgi:hypothetical protein